MTISYMQTLLYFYETELDELDFRTPERGILLHFMLPEI